MKKLILFAAAALFSTAALHAQKTDSVRIAKRAEAKKSWEKKEGARPGDSRMNLQKELGLSDAQGKKVQELNKEYMQKMKTIRSDESLTDDQKKEKMKSLVKEREGKLKTIVGPEKYKEMVEKRKEMKKKGDEKMKEHKKKKAVEPGEGK